MTSTRLNASLASREEQNTTRQQAIARVLGASTCTSLDWRRLLSEGVLVRLHVRRCSFTARLYLEDIGITVEEEATKSALAKMLVLGEKRLLPERYMKALARLESAARYALKQRTFRTEIGSFLPATAYRAWREETERLAEEYYSLRDEILANYRTLVAEVLSEYELVARDTFRRLRASHPDLQGVGEATFVINYCNRVHAQIPTPVRIRNSFAFECRRLSPVSQVEALSAPAEESMPPGPGEVRWTQQARERDRALMREDLKQQARAQMQSTLDSVLQALVEQLRSLVYDTTVDVLATLSNRGGESFSPRSVVQLKNLIAQVRELNFYGDTEMEQMMARLQRIVDLPSAQRQRSLEEIGRQLRAIATVTRSTLLELDQEPRSAREFIIADIPTISLVCEARQTLGLESLPVAGDAFLEREERPTLLRQAPSSDEPEPQWQRAFLPL